MPASIYMGETIIMKYSLEVVRNHDKEQIQFLIRHARDDNPYITPIVTFSWYTDCTGVWGFEFEIRSSHIDNLSDAREIVKSVDGDGSIGHTLKVLLNIATEVVRDERSDLLVPLAEILPSKYKRWVTEEIVETHHNAYYCLAQDEDEAKTYIIMQASRKIDIPWVSEFISHGLPVKMQKTQLPDVTPIWNWLVDRGAIE